MDMNKTMRQNVKFLITLIILILSFPIVVAEELRYVSDSFSITMRTGQGTEHKVIKSIRTGTKLDLLESSDNGYSKVRLENGTEGWVLSRFLLNQPISKDRLKRAEEKSNAKESFLPFGVVE